MSAEQTAFNFEPSRLARRTDPRSSHAAAKKMVDTGAIRGQALTTHNALKRYPCNTTKTLADVSGLDRYMLARRMPDLWKAGLALRIERRENDTLWYAIIG